MRSSGTSYNGAVTSGKDTFIGGSGDEAINAGAGNNSIDAGSCNDFIDPGSDFNTLMSRSGRDLLIVRAYENKTTNLDSANNTLRVANNLSWIHA
jgi:Ca2+-binding RTX toxin-like protein